MASSVGLAESLVRQHRWIAVAAEHPSAFLHSIVWSDCPLVWLHEGPPHVLIIAYTIWQRDVQIALLLAAGEVSGAMDAQGERPRLVL